MRIKLKRNIFHWELNWKTNVKYLAKHIKYNGNYAFEVYYPGSAIVSIFSPDDVEVVSDKKGF